jgi:uncharacterized protein (DUF433 family)
MSSAARLFAEPVEVGVADGVMSGEPVVLGTRVPVETILVSLKRGSSAREIYEDFPTLPAGSIEAAEAWAVRELGADWQARIGQNGFQR